MGARPEMPRPRLLELLGWKVGLLQGKVLGALLAFHGICP